MAKPIHPDRRPAVVTGASSGIGAATATLLASLGHPVVLGARRLDRLESLAEEIRSQGGEAYPIQLDLADHDSIEHFAELAMKAVGDVEIVVSNAARNQPGSAIETAPDDFEETLRINIAGPHHLVRAFAPSMVERRRGDLVFVTSDVTERPRPSMSAYVASKWGLEGFIRALMMEMEGSGVRASIVRPGATLTEMGFDWDPGVTQDVLTEWQGWGLARHGNFLRPLDVARAVITVVTTDRNTHLAVVEVQPEAPVVHTSKAEEIEELHPSEMPLSGQQPGQGGDVA
ncbi:MAG: SDR family oxidoreductase [Actinomycetota bacterium]